MRLWITIVPILSLVLSGCTSEGANEPPAISEGGGVPGSPSALAMRPAAPGPDAHSTAAGTNASGPAPVTPESPSRISFEVPLFLFSHVAVEWERVARVLPDGFAPAGHPYVPIADKYWGTPEGTFADVMVAVFGYEQAMVDGTPLGAGHTALAWATARPPDEYRHLYPQGADAGAPGYVVLGATVSDPHVADALGRWGIDAQVGQLETEFLPGPEAHATARVCCAPFDFTLDVTQPAARPTSSGPDVQLVNFVAKGDGIVAALHNGLSAHKSLVGPGSVQGALGPLGELTAAGAFAQIIWFGDDATTPSGVLGTFRFDYAGP